MLPDDRERVGFSEAPTAALAERTLLQRTVADHGTDEYAAPHAADAAELGETGEHPADEREWFGKHPAYPRNTPEHLHTPDLQTRFYVGLWLPGAGALLTYAIMRGNYWAAFVGIELLLVGWFTLAKL